MGSDTQEAGAGNPAWQFGRRAAVWLLFATAAAASAAVYVTRPAVIHAPTGADAAAARAAPVLAERLDHSVVERTGVSESLDATGASIAVFGP